MFVLLYIKAPGINSLRLHWLFAAVGATEALSWSWWGGSQMGRNVKVSPGMSLGHSLGTLLYMVAALGAEKAIKN